MSMDNRDRDDRPGRTVGEAANRFVTFYILMGILGLGLSLFFLFYFFVPMWNSMFDSMRMMTP